MKNTIKLTVSSYQNKDKINCFIANNLGLNKITPDMYQQTIRTAELIDILDIIFLNGYNVIINQSDGEEVTNMLILINDLIILSK